MQHLILDNESHFAGSLPLAVLRLCINHILYAIDSQNEEDTHQVRKVINLDVEKNRTLCGLLSHLFNFITHFNIKINMCIFTYLLYVHFIYKYIYISP